MRSKIRSEIREKMQINAKMFENLPNCLIFVSSETCCNTFCNTHFEKGTITTKKNPSNWFRPPVFYLQIIAKKGEKNTKNCL